MQSPGHVEPKEESKQLPWKHKFKEMQVRGGVQVEDKSLKSCNARRE